MREITRHTPGKLFIVVLVSSLVFAVAILPFLFEPGTLFFGWITVPVLSGAVIMLVWLVALAIYVKSYWPYR
ncbi:MAG TPA: hypothetical protein VLH18_03710 [Candidatus Limnocylindrales bacterium]|nr:hypothetical protein [Candidatus Limnocylindrales bacterium]